MSVLCLSGLLPVTMRLLLLLASVAVASAQVPVACGGPKAFTGRFMRFDEDRKIHVDGKIFYDAENKRIREFEREQIGSEHAFFDKLKLYDLNVEYRLNLKTRHCNTSNPMPPNWMPYGVPPQSRFQGEVTMGLIGDPNEELTIAMFDGEFSDKHKYHVQVTQPSCFPVNFVVSGEHSSRPMDGGRFYDVVNGITDPEAFIPPRECLH